MTEQNQFLGTEKIGTLLSKISGPIIISILVQGLYNVIDTIFVARGVGTLAIGGLSIVMPIQIFIASIGITLGYGMASIIARKLGAQEYDQARRVAGNGVFLAALFGGFITVGGLVFLTPILRALGTTSALFPYSADYLRIILLGTFFLLLTIIFYDVFRSEGKSNLLLMTVLVGTVLNIFLDWYFIFILKMGVKGVAIATVISQIVAALYAFYFFIAKKIFLTITLRELVPDTQIIRNIILLGIPNFFNQFGFSLSIVIINNTIHLYGPNQADLLISANGILWRINVFLVSPIIGFVAGFQTIAGFNYGAKKLERVKESIRLSLWVTTIYSIIVSCFMIGIPQNVIGIFSSDKELISTGAVLSRFIFAGFSCSGIFLVGTSLFLALGKAKPSFFLSISRTYYFLFPALIIFPALLGFKNIWYAFPFADITCTVLVAVFLAIEIRSLSREYEGESSHKYAGNQV